MELFAYSMQDFTDAEKQLKKEGKFKAEWGPWEFKKSNLTLKHKSKWYELDLEKCNNADQIFKWILYYSRKGASVEDIGFLVFAIRDIFGIYETFHTFGLEAADHNYAKKIIKGRLKENEIYNSRDASKQIRLFLKELKT